MRDDDPADLVHDEFAAALFGDSPLGRSILGTVDTIGALTRRQIAGYYQRRYEPASMVISIAGHVDHAQAVQLVRRAFDGRVTEPKTSARTASNAAARPTAPVTVVPDDTEQANIVLGNVGVSRHDERRFAVGVLSAALGGGMSSRLFQRIREERGLAYSVYSFSSGYSDTGQFGVYAGCQPGKADEVLGLVVAELDAAARGEFTDAEIERGKGQMRGGIVLGLEDSSSLMTRFGKRE
jgi:predicted Zn-dependent peptidase